MKGETIEHKSKSIIGEKKRWFENTKQRPRSTVNGTVDRHVSIDILNEPDGTLKGVCESNAPVIRISHEHIPLYHSSVNNTRNPLLFNGPSGESFGQSVQLDRRRRKA